jgi:hypothetical protein
VKVKAFRIPKQIVIPGLLVVVNQRPRNHPDLGEDVDATWDYDGGKGGRAVITICQSVSLRRKRYLVWHELGHVIWDLLHDVRDNHKKIVDKP